MLSKIAVCIAELEFPVYTFIVLQRKVGLDFLRWFKCIQVALLKNTSGVNDQVLVAIGEILVL
jgi:hypothetical protein